MKTFKVTYQGNSSRFRNFESEVNANSEREAVEMVFQQVMDENYFPEPDGTIKDCDGHTLAEQDDNIIEYDGGFFMADELKRFFIISIFYGQETEYWNSVFDNNTTKKIESAEGFKTIQEARRELEQTVKPYAEKHGWNVGFSIDLL